MKILILYSELAEYSLACFRQLHRVGARIALIHWPVNPEAPFLFDLSFCAVHYSREQLTDQALSKVVDEFSPDLILCSGWMDKGYVKVCRKWRSKMPVVLSMDNHWNGSLKQQLARIISPFTIRRTFSHAFVPGEAQKQYALKLGFPSEHIKTGFYAADADKFENYFRQISEERQITFPTRFLYLGRYIHHKGIFDLWEAFKKFHDKDPSWELWCVGTGDRFEHRVEAPGIRHFGFVQPSELLPILKQCGVYILPSHFEPWGVSVQEMAIAGFPMLLSDKVGARETFLEEGKNGATFKTGDTEELFARMLWIASRPKEELGLMAQKSHELGISLKPQAWARTLLSFLGNKNQ